MRWLIFGLINSVNFKESQGIRPLICDYINLKVIFKTLYKLKVSYNLKIWTTFKILMVVENMVSHTNFPSSFKTIFRIVIPGMDVSDRCRDPEK